MRTRPVTTACLVVATTLAWLVLPATGAGSAGAPDPSTTTTPTGAPVATTVPPSTTAPTAVPTPEVPEGPVRPALTGADPSLVAALDAVVAASPADTCVTVVIDGLPVYGHDGEQPLIPASNEKLLTTSAALDLLGPDLRFHTALVAGAAPVDGVVAGDLTIVGGGDPGLVTAAYASYRGIGSGRPTTSLEALVDQLRSAGTTHVTGRVVGDDSRYDRVRQVASWPANYFDEEQSGNLSALGVDDGYLLVRDGDRVVDRERAEDPALATARAFTDLARAAGITVDGEPASGAAAGGAVEVAGIDSPPLSDLVQDILRTSDNQAAELLLKELGRAEGGAGTTAAGATVVAGWAAGRGLAPAGAVVVDGSGLDRGNRVTCNELVSLLDASGGPEGTIGQGLAVAGESGTLAARFRGTPAEGKLRAKTGSLDPASSLAGFVELPEGRTATFAFIANAGLVPSSIHGIQEQLGIALATYLAPCPADPAGGVVAPVAALLAGLGAMTAVPSAAAALPGTLAAFDAVEGRVHELGDRCLAADPDAAAVLVP